MKSVQEKFETVIEKNTFYFFNKKFEEKYEGYLNSIKETLLVLKNKIQTEGLKKEFFEELISRKENGLRALLALTGFSNESLQRLTTIVRVTNMPELSKLVNKEHWPKEKDLAGITEWKDEKISSLISENPYFCKGIVNLFFEGATIPFLVSTMPLFELKKLSISKLKFELPEMIDTLIRYKEKGSYSGMRENNPEIVIEAILDKLSVTFEKGDLGELIKSAPAGKRTMDFIIPNKKTPRIIIESSYLVTTSSGQGDKSKTEISIDALIKRHYPDAHFWGFVDGIGWYVRKNDLKRMVGAYEDVFTFHPEELERFEDHLKKILSK
jgi:hypothetical protein